MSPEGAGASSAEWWRRLGIAEEAVDLLERRRGAGHFLQTVALEDVELDAELLARSCGAVARRHPLLRARIESSAGGPAFVAGPEDADVVRVVAREDDDAWLAVVDGELNTRFDDGTPLVRITLLTSGDGGRSEVIITCHHAIVDGEAMGSLTNELLSTYDAMDRDRYEPTAGSTAPLPAVEHMLGYPLTPEFRSGRLTEFIERQISLKQAHDIGGFESSEPAETPLRSALVHRSLPSSFVDAVRERGRSEGASVQGALGAALIAAGRDEIHSDDPCVLPLVSAVTLRRRLPGLSSADLGLFSSGVRTVHPVARATDFWQLAREVRQAIAAGLDAEDDVCALLLQREAVDRYMTTTEPGFAWLSNPGVLHLPSEVGRGRVRAAHGAFSMHAFGPLIHTHASTAGRQFTWNFVYPEPAISRSVADAFSRRAVEHLVNACRPDLPASLSPQT